MHSQQQRPGEGRVASMWTPGRIISSLVVAILVASIGYYGLFQHAYEKKGVSAPIPDRDIKTIDGETIKFSDYRGKVLVVDFWATWCPQCVYETPELVRIANQFGSQGVQVLGLHIEDNGRSSAATIEDFIKQYRIPYKIGLATNDMFTQYLGADDDRIPQTLIIGRDGRLVAHLVGYDPSEPDYLSKAIRQALSGT